MCYFQLQLIEIQIPPWFDPLTKYAWVTHELNCISVFTYDIS